MSPGDVDADLHPSLAEHDGCSRVHPDEGARQRLGAHAGLAESEKHREAQRGHARGRDERLTCVRAHAQAR